MQTALISALTAAVVTLFIEYLAKPRLEARKDRIVESARNRRKLVAELLDIVAVAAHLKLEGSIKWPREHWDKPINDLAQKLTQVKSTLLVAAPTINKKQFSAILRPLISAQTTCGTLKNVVTYGLSDGSESRHVAPALSMIAHDCTTAATRAEVSRWRIFKYRKLINQVHVDMTVINRDLQDYFANLPDNHAP